MHKFFPLQTVSAWSPTMSIKIKKIKFRNIREMFPNLCKLNPTNSHQNVSMCQHTPFRKSWICHIPTCIKPNKSSLIYMHRLQIYNIIYVCN